MHTTSRSRIFTIALLFVFTYTTHPAPQQHVRSRIPEMLSTTELDKHEKTLTEKYQADQKRDVAIRRYNGSRGLSEIVSANASADQKKELLLELLPRQVTELILRLQVGHIMKLDHEKPVNAILFHGPPGLGKTEAAAMLAREGGLRFVELAGTGLVNKYQNSGAETFQTTIDEALKHADQANQGSLIFIDEIGAVGRDLNDADATMVTNRQVELATTMHIWQTIIKYKDDKRLIFCFADNDLKRLHKTFISRFREEHIIEFKLPDKTQRAIALKHYLEAYDFPLVRELQVAEAQAAKVFSMLVKNSDGMNYRALRDAVKSFKGQKSLSALSNEDVVKAAKYLKEHQPAEFALLQKNINTEDGKIAAMIIDAMIIAVHEQLTGKPVAVKASTAKELYAILQRTKAKDGYDWKEMVKKWSESMSKHFDPWLHRTGASAYIIPTLLAVGGFCLNSYLNSKSSSQPTSNTQANASQLNAQIAQSVNTAVAVRFAVMATQGAQTVAGLAAATAIANSLAAANATHAASSQAASPAQVASTAIPA